MFCDALQASGDNIYSILLKNPFHFDIYTFPSGLVRGFSPIGGTGPNAWFQVDTTAGACRLILQTVPEHFRFVEGDGLPAAIHPPLSGDGAIVQTELMRGAQFLRLAFRNKLAFEAIRRLGS